MKKLKFITILFSIWLVKFTIDCWYSSNYNYLGENKNLDIEIKHISNNDIEFNNSETAAILDSLDSNGVAVLVETLPAKEDYVGWIYLDTIKQRYYFKETFYKQLQDGESSSWREVHRWITLDKNGRQIDSTGVDSLMPPSSTILLNDLKGYFPDWSDKKSIAYINYFTRERFNWSILNPFKGMGNPTGGRTQPYWYGHAYYTVNHFGKKIRFKAEVESFEDGEYGDNINFSTTPTRFKGMPLLTFVILKNNFERSGLYIIVNKHAKS